MEPLRQRLELYGIACVQIDPRQAIQPWQWGLPGLEAVARNSSAWEGLFSRCQPFSLHTHAPVISNSLAFLQRIRRKSPARWLVHCQTAFEKQPDRRALVGLMTRKPLPFLHRNDFAIPLRWLPGLWRGEPLCIVNYPKPHPQALRLKAIHRQYPDHQVRCLEDGRLLIQLNLFGENLQALPRPDPALESMDRHLRPQTAELKGACLVLSKTRDRFAWFRRDLVRLWPGRHRFWEGELPAYPTVHGSMLVPMTNSDLKWGIPNLKAWPMLHLDGDARTHAYRHARQLPSGPSSWVSEVSVLGHASWRWQRKTFWFQKTGFGWGNPVNTQPSPNLSAEFMELSACFQVA